MDQSQAAELGLDAAGCSPRRGLSERLRQGKGVPLGVGRGPGECQGLGQGLGAAAGGDGVRDRLGVRLGLGAASGDGVGDGIASSLRAARVNGHIRIRLGLVCTSVLHGSWGPAV